MDSKERKLKIVDNIVTQQYLEDAKRSLGSIDMGQINSVAKTIQLVFDSIKKPLEHMEEIRETYASISSPMSDMPQMEYVRPVGYDVLEVLHEIKDQNAKRKKEIGLFIFNIKEKTLERDTETRSFKYKFLEKGMNFELVKILVDRDGFRQTRHLKENIGSKTNEAVRKKVGEINEKIKEGLRLDKEFKIIIGEPGAGYKINPDIKIKVIEE